MAPKKRREAFVAASDKPALSALEQLVAEAACILFLDATAAVCAARRLGRRQRSAQEDADIEAYYHRFVWPAHLEHVCVTAPPMPCAACPHALNIFSPHAGGR